jgi:phosphoribosyl 1,2-cyclic phosphodiesterase
VWGVRGTCPVPGPTTLRYGGNTSCVEVRLANGTQVIFDAGTGLRALGLHRWPAPLAGVAGDRAGFARHEAAVLLTHRHSDHVMGLAHFVPQVAATHAVRIVCPGVTATALHGFVAQQLSPPLFPPIDGVTDAYVADAFSEEDPFPVFVAGDQCVVHALPAHHPGGASVLRLDDAQGPVLAYAPDNELALWTDAPTVVAWRSSLRDALRGIPVLVHDATYTDDELAAHRGWGHSSAEEATRFAMACDAGTLLLTHHHPDRDDASVDAIVERCREIAVEAGSGMRVMGACEGQTVFVDREPG